MTMWEFLIVNALVQVKSKRMDESLAIKEALRQRYAEPMTIDNLDDLYVAGTILYDKYKWFRGGVSALVKMMQNNWKI